ncbi:hypothetical protein [Streptomyces olivaceoviridis]|uniref:hypothetical protein n=1 Tax=Streptomyces olivaceoviridis TaxID=1921 RepID=UPI0037969683
MHRARVEKTKRDVFRHHIGPPHQFSGDLICWKCTAAFVAVRAHTNKGAPVQAQYRLAPKTEHDSDCPLNPTVVTNHIAHGSHGLAEADDRGILRLNLPENISAVPTTGPDDDVTGQDAVRHTVATVRPLLPPAVNSAAKIAQFLQMHDFDKDIVDRFKIRPHNGRAIPWGRFCYGPTTESYAELYERCRRAEVFTHPIAVFGTVRRVSHDRSGRPYIVLALNVPAGDGSFHVTIRSWHASLIEPLITGVHVLAVGAGWEIFPRGNVPQLRLWADEHWQLAHWTTTGDGQSTAPHCPPPLTAVQRARARAEARTRRAAGGPAGPPAPSASPTPTEAITPPPASETAVDPAPELPQPPPARTAPAADASSADTPMTDPHDQVSLAQPAAIIAPRPKQPPADGTPQPVPPLPAFPPPAPGEGGRRWALGQWLKRVRRR